MNISERVQVPVVENNLVRFLGQTVDEFGIILHVAKQKAEKQDVEEAVTLSKKGCLGIRLTLKETRVDFLCNLLHDICFWRVFRV